MNKGKQRAYDDDDNNSRQSNAAMNATEASSDYPQVEVWTVQWREPQTRKNKSWEKDGFLVVKGSNASLKNEDGKSLGSTILAASVVADDELKIGGRECKIDDRMTYTDYLKQFPSSSSAVERSRLGVSSSRMHTPARAPPHVGTSSSATRPPLLNLPAHPLVSSSSSLRPSGLSATMATTRLPAPGMPSLKRKSSRENDEPRLMEVSEKEDLPALDSKRARVDNGADRTRDGKYATTDRSLSVDRTNVDTPREGTAPRNEGIGAPTLTKQKSSGSGATEYLCQYRKYSTKKHATWEGDAILVVSGKSGSLKNRETRKTITNGIVSLPQPFAPELQINMGGYTIEIESVFDPSTSAAAAPRVVKPIVPSPRTLPLAVVARATSPVTSNNFYIPGVTPRASKPFQTPTGLNASTSSKSGNRTIGPQPRYDPKKAGAVVMLRPDEEHQRAYNTKELPIVDVVLDPKIGDKLREHQKEGVKFMYESVMGMRGEGQGCILADEMGLGKSVQAISLIWTLLKQNPYWGTGTGVIERAIIVCPVTLVKNWNREIRQWLGGDLLRPFIADNRSNIKSFCASRSYSLLIIGYERLRIVIDDIKAIQPPIGLIICDEGHRLKSSDAKISKVLRSLSCKRRVILSGTPIQNDLGEYHSMVDFVNPGLLDTYSTFKKVFENAIVKSRERGASRQDKKLGAERSDQLTRLGQAFLLRRTADVISQYLPPKFEYTLFIAPTPLELAIYQEILDGSAVRAVLEGSGTEQLSLLMILRQLCNTPGLLMQQLEKGKMTEILKKPVVDLLRNTGNDPFDFALSGKLLALGTMLANLRKAGDEKVVVVSNFTLTLDIIEKHCRKMKYPLSRLDGQTPQTERVALVEGFNHGKVATSFIFLLSSKAGGTGLNITGASRLILVDSDWNPSTDLQAMARIHREGQKKQCYIYRLLTAGTVDEKIYQRQVTKLGLSGSLMDDDQSRGASKDAFSLSDLRNIFTLHRGVACQTHDLLGCRCDRDLNSDDENTLDDAAMDLDDTLSSSLPQPELAGFQQASQLPAKGLDESRTGTEGSKNLSMLNTLAHYNCCDEASTDEIEDRLLRSVVYERVCQTAEGEQGSTPTGKWDYKLRGGQIGFVFGRKSG